MRSQKPNSEGNVHNLILENVSEIIYFVETNGDPTRGSVKFVSPSVEEIVGYAQEEFTKDPTLWISIIHPDDAGAVQRTTEEMFATKKRIPRQYRLRHKVTGEYIWIEDKPSLIIDRNGKITGYVGIAREPQRALRESEQKFRAQFDGFPLPTYTWQIQGEQIVLVGYNVAASRVMGQYVQQLLGRSARDIYPDRPDILDDFGRCISTKGTIHREIAYRFRISGDLREIAVDYVFVPQDMIMVYTEDITERKRSREAVRENEERLRVALASIDMAVFNQDTDLRYTWMYQPQLGYTTERVIGKTDAELLPHEAARQVTELKRRVLETSASVRGEVQVDWKDRTFYYDLIVEPLRNANGQVMGITGASLDITERKGAEQELQKLSRVVQQTADIVFITDRNGLIEYVNPAFEKTTGYRRKEVIGKTSRIFKSGEHPVSFYERLWKTILEGHPFRSVLINKKKDGTTFFEEKTITPLRAEEGTITHFVSTGKDVTERMKAEEIARSDAERLQALSKQLLEIQENERRSLARELHDEIGQTLTSLKILLEMSTKAKADNARESLQEALGLISSLIGHVRNLSLNLRPPILDDLGLVPAIRWHLLHRTEKMGIETHFKAEPEEIHVSGEIKTACFRVAQEALTNVLKHSKPKSVEVQVMKRGANLELTVRDDGTGFDVDSAFRRAAAGESFGLLGMQERVRLAGGTLVIRSEQGRGSEIQATFLNVFIPSLTDSEGSTEP
jgi:PAS domain S-box-containing protein